MELDESIQKMITKEESSDRTDHRGNAHFPNISRRFRT